jgi:AraC family transcriptional regulator of adaptative response / DNA-3-methyladenine glycosylase II
VKLRTVRLDDADAGQVLAGGGVRPFGEPGVAEVKRMWTHHAHRRPAAAPASRSRRGSGTPTYQFQPENGLRGHTDVRHVGRVRIRRATGTGGRHHGRVTQTFSAVVTTGIYCRPGCSARPNPENVRPFELAAAAEAAGFRACLRCRPYRQPQPVVWEGQALVCRAVRLVVDGFLDGHDEAELGRRLGISARHLRRLFQAELGATPDELARSRRVHFARRLLDDTDLTVTDIAFASGFGSLRQLNRACRDVFRATPTELRARRRRADRLVADGGLVLRLPYEGRLDWDALLDYFAARAIPGVEAVDGDTYRRTIVVDGDPGVLELRPGGGDHLLLRAHLPHWEGLIHVVDRARRIARLDDDPADAVEHLSADPLLAPLVAARPGLRVPGTWDPFETGIRAIVGQQVSVRGATTLAGRIVERLGTPVPGLQAWGLTHTFPTATTLAEGDLDGLGFTGGRITALRSFSAAVAGDDVRLDGSVAHPDLVRSIGALAGLGPWTAEYLALRMGERDAFPTTDLGLRRSAGVEAAELAALAERWRPWRAVAAVHLWQA